MNGDEKLLVEFRRAAVQDNYTSAIEGRPVYVDEDQISIRIPGDKLVSIVRPVEPNDKLRWPTEWAAYLAGQSQAQSGTPVSLWPELTPGQAATFEANGFRFVHQIAAASDAQLSALGMAAGGSPSVIRRKAEAFIGGGESSRNPPAKDVEAMRAEIERRKEVIGFIDNESAAGSLGLDDKRGPGRPRKVEHP